MTIDSNMDADDYGHRIIDCINNCNSEPGFINLVKIDVGQSRISWENLDKLIKGIKNMFNECGATNCVFIPVGENSIIKDITIDYIKVINDEIDK